MLVTFRDLREIHRFYPSLSIQNLIVLYDAATEYEDRMILERFHPALLVFDQDPTGKTDSDGKSDSNSTWQAYLGLKFEKLPDGRTVCPQLDRSLGRCTIHDHKPLVCRTYPHVMDEAGKLQRLEKVRCEEPWGDSQVLPAKERDRIHAGVKRAYAAHDKFIEEVKEWNKCSQGKTVADFIAFALRPRNADDFE